MTKQELMKAARASIKLIIRDFKSPVKEQVLRETDQDIQDDVARTMDEIEKVTYHEALAKVEELCVRSKERLKKKDREIFKLVTRGKKK